MTEPEPLQQIDRTYVRFRNRKLSYFSGCDYFRLASHPAVLKAAQEGVKKFGLNVAASRLTSGNHALYRELEKRLAKFFDAPDALLVSSGYMTNLAVAQALAGNFSHALIDERAHPSLLDAAQMFGCPVLQFTHRAARGLEQALQRCGPGTRPILLTDGMFAHDGSHAPLRAYLNILPQDAVLLVDDAHGAGVLGKTGKGTLELEHVGRSRVVQCVTLSKAFGAYGGAILGTRALRQRIVERSRIFVAGTPLPLPLASAALKAISVLKAEQGLRTRLQSYVAYVREALRKAGLELPETAGPIVPLQVKDRRELSKLNRALLAADIYPPLIHYPGSPANGFFRFVISSEHTHRQLDHLISVLCRVIGRVNEG
jgi:7-keto-8-aminopelargonate synthetase-like enzyme